MSFSSKSKSKSKSPVPEAAPVEPMSVLFCCMGNICRSTMAEGVFAHLTREEGPYKGLVTRIDSCGTDAYHIGDEPDKRTMLTLAKNGITDYSHRARQVRASDFHEFDYIFAMDKSNLEQLLELQQRKGAGGKAQVKLFGEYSATGFAEDIKDPYYGGGDGFEIAFLQVMRFSNNFLEKQYPQAVPPMKMTLKKRMWWGMHAILSPPGV